MINLPIRATVAADPAIPWRESTSCTHYGLPENFRGLVLVESSRNVYYMDKQTVLFINYLEVLQ